MKAKIAIFSTLLLLTAFAFAQDKVAESSEKKMPKWAISMLEQDYVIKSGDGNTLQDAQQQSITLVKQEVVRSIAENVTSTSTLNTSEDAGNVSSSYRQSIVTRANKVPYVQGISLSIAEASYWEKITNKKEGRTFYRFYIKVPFSRAQLGKLVMEYKAEDMKITQRIDDLEVALSGMESVEQIDAAIDELGGWAATLEDNRKDKASLLQARYRALYESIVVVDEGSSLGTIAYRLELGGKAIQSSRKPQVKSTCAAIAQVNIGAACTISYRYDGCYSDIENFVDVSYRFGNKTVSQKFLIPLQ